MGLTVFLDDFCYWSFDIDLGEDLKPAVKRHVFKINTNRTIRMRENIGLIIIGRHSGQSNLKGLLTPVQIDGIKGK